MQMKKIQMKDYLIDISSTIGDALEAITNNHRGSVVVVAGKDRVLEGVISDGDIRRALVAGATTLAPIEKILNRNPTTMDNIEATSEAIAEKLKHNRQINVIPIIQKNRVVDVIVRDTDTENKN